MASASPVSPTEPLLQATGLTKRYPGVLALEDFSVTLRAGRVHALCGENGAGKSTIVKIVTGAIQPDEGEIRVGGTSVTGFTPRSAAALGVAAIHQERQIAYELSVGENVLMGRVPVRRGTVDWRALRRTASERLQQVGLDVDPRISVRKLSVAQLQALEIARALSADARVLVMDEPTSALSREDIEGLMALVLRLKSQGVAILYISHHLGEVFQVADDLTVLRDGRKVAETTPQETTEAKLVSLMLGRDPEKLAVRLSAAAGATSQQALIRARNLASGTGLEDVSLAVGGGEIVCVTGAIGSGRRELARCLAGVDRPDAGEVTIGGATPRSPRDAIRKGVVYVPEDRKREGLMLSLSVLENVAVGPRSAHPSFFVNPRSWARRVNEFVRSLEIKTRSVSTEVRLLSGGNQQKTILARWLATSATGFVLDEPTAGVDVGAKVEIYRLLRQLADNGAAIVLFTSDTDEIRTMADRVIVLKRGRIAGELQRGEIDEERILDLEMRAS